MDIEELKHTWHALDLRMQRLDDRHAELFRENRLQRLRTGMLPLALSYFGLILLAMFGVFAVSLDPPSSITSSALFYSAIVCSLYLLGVVALSFVALMRYGQIDYSAPVVRIQEQLARLHKAHVQCGMFASATWLLMWLPFAVVIFYNFTGMDIATTLPSTYWLANVLVAAAGIGAAWALLLRAQRNPRSRFATKVLDWFSGATLRRAQAELDELERFLED